MQQKRLYTDSLDQDTKTHVRRIDSANDIEKFVSQPYMMSSSDHEGYCEWFEAKKLKNKMWSIKKHTQFIATEKEPDDTIRQTQTVATGLCFFDALYLCAMEEKYRTEQQSKKLANVKRKELFIDAPSMKNAAKKSFQPFDLNGLPMPAAEGEILVDGTFHPSAMKLAQKTLTAELLPEETEDTYRNKVAALIPAESLEISAKTTEVDDANVSFSRAFNLNKIMKKIGKGAHTAAAVHDRGVDLIDGKRPKLFRDWYSDLDYDGGALVTAGLAISGGISAAALIVTAIGGGFAIAAPIVASPFLMNIGLNYRAGFHYQNFKLKRIAKALPDSQHKSLLLDFTKAADANIHYGRVAKMIEKHGVLKPMQLRSAYRRIDKAARILGQTELQANQLKDAVAKGSFPSRYTFERKLSQLYSELVDHRDRYVRDVLEHNEHDKSQISTITEKWPSSSTNGWDISRRRRGYF